MPAYTLAKDAVEKKRLPADAEKKRGELVVYTLEIQDGDGRKFAEVVQKPETKVPKAGETMNGTLEETNFGLKFVKDKGGFGGRGGKGDYRSPEQIMRSYAQSQALQYWKLKHDGDPTYLISTWAEFQAVVELFYQDVKGAS